MKDLTEADIDQAIGYAEDDRDTELVHLLHSIKDHLFPHEEATPRAHPTEPHELPHAADDGSSYQ